LAWSVEGYITPTRLWNKGKRQEWLERRVYKPLKQQEK